MHYHIELELIMIKGATGTRVIGASVGSFEPNDIILIGKNVPHLFLHDDSRFNKNRFQNAEAIVIQFNEAFLGNTFLQLPELTEIRHLFMLARQGLNITGKAKAKIIPLIEKMPATSPFHKILGLLEILGVLVHERTYNILGSRKAVQDRMTEDDPRIIKIFDYTFQNFDQHIEVKEVADLINLTKESFCRYFKAKTQKTYMEFLIEFRIKNACQMIVEDNKSIKEIGYTCGFDTLSNFYYQFKKIMKQSPLEYKQLVFNGKSDKGHDTFPSLRDPCTTVPQCYNANSC